MLAQYVLIPRYNITAYIHVGRLNARTRFRAMAEATIPLALNDLNTLTSTQFNHESSHLVRIYFIFPF